jgi:hypothetical protein
VSEKTIQCLKCGDTYNAIHHCGFDKPKPSKSKWQTPTEDNLVVGEWYWVYLMDETFGEFLWILKYTSDCRIESCDNPMVLFQEPGKRKKLTSLSANKIKIQPAPKPPVLEE